MRTSRRLSLDEYFLQMLELVAARSTCYRRAVGAILVDKKGSVISTGYNGVSSGLPHCVDSACLGAFDLSGDSSRCMAVHAEAACLLQARGRLDDAHTLYCSCSPCFTCAKLIANTNIQRVVYQKPYADTLGLDVLVLKGIMLTCLANEQTR